MGAQAYLFDPVAVRAAGAAMAVILIVGALAKLRDIELFRYAVENYRLLEGRAAGAFARAFPLLELAAGVALLIEPARALGLWLGLTMLSLATGAVAISLVRGLTRIECGCGSVGQRISWGLVVRNVCLAAAVLLAGSEEASRALGLFDYFTVAGIVLALLAVYACANQLLANQPFLKELQS